MQKKRNAAKKTRRKPIREEIKSQTPLPPLRAPNPDQRKTLATTRKEKKTPDKRREVYA
jgi:hypothetical protein